MKLRFAVMIAPALALGFLAVSAEAQQHKATRLGNPATRFAQRLPKKPDDVRVLLRSDKMKADVAAILNEVGWKGNLEDFDRAAASAEITTVQIAPGTRLPVHVLAARTGSPTRSWTSCGPARSRSTPSRSRCPRTASAIAS